LLWISRESKKKNNKVVKYKNYKVMQRI
jgi:hypothetical protein